MTDQISRPRRKSAGRRKDDERAQDIASDSIVIAELGQRALTRTSLAEVMDDAAALVSERLGTEYVKVLEIVPGGEGFLLTAGVGWPAGYVGQVVVPLSPDSQAAYTLHHGGPIVAEDLRAETRFKGMPILHEHGIVSGISTVLRGRERVHGIMTAHTTRRRKFSAEEVTFLESVAAIVAAAMDRREIEEALLESEERLRLAMDSGGMGTWEWNPRNGDVIWSETLEKIHGLAPGSFPGTSIAFFEMIHPEDREQVQRTIARSLLEGVHEMEYRARRADGSVRWLSSRGVLVRDARGEPVRMIGVCMDITDRKALVGQLESARERVDNLLANVPGVVWEAWGKPDSSAQHIDFVSNYVETMLGYTVEEWTSIPNFWLTIVHPEDKERAAAAASATFEAGFGTNEFRWVAKDGRVIWVEAQSTVIRDEAGNTVGMRGVTMDITERRQSEARIRETEERFSKAFHNSPAGVSIVTASKRRFVDVNEAFLEIIGYSRDEVIGKRVDGLHLWFSEEDRQKLARSLAEGKGHAQNVEVQLRTRGGESRSVLGSAELITLGGETCVLTLMYDITERKQAEVELRSARALAEASVNRQAFLAEASSILASSLDYEVTMASLANLCVPFLADWCAVDVLEGSDLRRVAVVHADPAKLEFASQLQERYPPEPDSPEVRQVFSGPSLHLPEISEELVVRSARDAEHLEIIRNLGLRSALAVALKASGRTVGILTLVTAESGRTYTERDVALAEDLGQRAGLAVENAMLYRASQEVQEELRRANEAKDEFLGLVSHELRTPITTIYGGARLLRTRGGNIDEASRLSTLEDIEHESERLHRIVEDLLVLARVELGEQIVTEPVLMQRTVEKSVSSFNKRRPARNFVVRLDDEMEPVRASDGYLEQILRNLLNNADKYSPPETTIEVVSDMRDGQAVISVMDRGPGIPAEEAELIFERFYRSHGTAKQASGAGIGLTVCKRLVEAQEGHIWAQPRDGGGLIVSFSLPLYEDQLQ
jgi:PAS domain S-box-containing protein